MEEKNKKATPVGAEKAAESYAYGREISVQDGAGYPFKEEIMRAFIVGAAWQKQRLIDKTCDWLSKSTILADTTMERFKKAMEEQQ